jgi:hypothetical protein
MHRTVLTFDTTHHALWAEEIARDHGLPVEVVPAPAAARAKCSLALETLPEELEGLRRLMTSEGVPHGVHSWEE